MQVMIGAENSIQVLMEVHPELEVDLIHFAEILKRLTRPPAALTESPSES